MTIRTFAAMIVPSMAPTCMNIPRPVNTWLSAQQRSSSAMLPSNTKLRSLIFSAQSAA